MSLNFDEDETPATAMPVDTNVAKRVNASDKRMINATTDVNQLVPFKYKWAWDMYLKASENNWMPQETNLEKDAIQLADPKVITEADCLALERALASLTMGDAGTGEVAIGIYRTITAPEARQFLLRQGMEEILVAHTYAYITETLKLDADVVLAQRLLPTAGAKYVFLAPYLATLTDVKFDTQGIENGQKLLKALIVYTVAMKGLFSVADIAQVLALGQVKKLPGTATIFQNLLRDKIGHTNFGIEVIQAIKAENPHLWTPEFKAECFALIEQAFNLEKHHAAALGFPTEFEELLQSAVGRISNQIGIASRASVPHTYTWLAAIMGLVERRSITSAPVEEKKVSTTLDWE